VYRAAKRVGASNKLAKEIANKIEVNAFDGITTKEIYKQVRALLHKQTPVAAIRFSLKEAMRKMGPAGFYFEKFIAAMYEEAGYAVKINQIVAGKCIRDYEIDFICERASEMQKQVFASPSERNKCRVKTPIIAKKVSESRTLPTALKMGECKYRNKPGDKVDMTIALANHARFLDIKNGVFLNKKQFNGANAKSVIVTNAKFSGHAIKYSECMGVELLGWHYPAGNGLERLIDKHQLYPVTILPSLNKHFATVFAQKDIMFVKDIAGVEPSVLARKVGVPINRITRIVKEAELLLT